MPPSSKKHPGAPLGNLNALKHGFYTRRLRKRDVADVQTTDLKGLAEEVALIRIFTRRMIETCDPSAGAYEVADILRIVCLAASTITRIIRAQFLLHDTGSEWEQAVTQAILQVSAELTQGDSNDPPGGSNFSAPIPPPRDAVPPVGTHPSNSADTFSPSLSNGEGGVGDIN